MDMRCQRDEAPVKPEPSGEGRVSDVRQTPSSRQESEMAKIRETEVEHDSEGRVIHTTERVERPGRRSGGGFGWGMLLGVVAIALGIIVFAYSRGSFETAGQEADRATAQIEQRVDTAVENTGDALETAGDNAEQAANEFGDEASN
jgi:hypothetical protein